jgi:hypothetical protein
MWAHALQGEKMRVGRTTLRDGAGAWLWMVFDFDHEVNRNRTVSKETYPTADEALKASEPEFVRRGGVL